MMDELLAEIHAERVACAGLGPWMVLRTEGEVAAYQIDPPSTSHPSKAIATLVAESTIDEIENRDLDQCTSPETDSPSSES